MALCMIKQFNYDVQSSYYVSNATTPISQLLALWQRHVREAKVNPLPDKRDSDSSALDIKETKRRVDAVMEALCERRSPIKIENLADATAAGSTGMVACMVQSTLITAKEASYLRGIASAHHFSVLTQLLTTYEALLSARERQTQQASRASGSQPKEGFEQAQSESIATLTAVYEKVAQRAARAQLEESEDLAVYNSSLRPSQPAPQPTTGFRLGKIWREHGAARPLSLPPSIPTPNK